MRPQEKKGSLCTGCPRFNSLRCTASTKVEALQYQILVVGEYPDMKSATANLTFSGHGGQIVSKAITGLKQTYPEYAGLNIRYTNAVQCGSDDDNESPNSATMIQCQPHLESTILATQPKVIVAMGPVALKQLGIKEKHGDARGRTFKHIKSGTPVLVTFGEKNLVAAPGVYETYKLDLKNAFELASKEEVKPLSLEEISKDYRLPTTIDEAIAVCKEITEYSEGGTPESWAISVDTETTTLHPHKESAKIIAFCFGWGKGRATTILFDHPFVDDDYKARLHELQTVIAALLASSKPKIFHNAKFDLKFIELKYKLPVVNVKWDTLLGEHLLDEDKKGNYGLKALTSSWLPTYRGYEDKLYDILQGADGISESDEVAQELEMTEEALQDTHPEYLQALREYHAQVIAYEEVDRTYQAALVKYFKDLDAYEYQKDYLEGRKAVWAVDVAEWPKGKRGKPKKPVKWFVKPSRPEAVKKPKRPEDPRTRKEKQISTDAGYENVPLHDLQVYGGVDGDVTRQLAQIQMVRIKNEKSRVAGLMQSHAVPASRILGLMEFEGCKIDQDYLEVADAGLRRIVENTEAELYNMSGALQPDGKLLNLNSSQTLANVLYNWGYTLPSGEKMPPYDILARTKKDQPSTAEKTLRPLVAYEDDNKTVPTKEAYFIERLLTWKKASKALNTFLSNTRVLSRMDGMVHSQFHLNGTGTGRLSSSDMNLQNIPKYLGGWNLKKLFVPDSDDYLFVNVDYKGAEVKIATAYAPNKDIISALCDGLDMHSFMASKVYNKSYEQYFNRDNPEYVPDLVVRKQLDKERTLIKRVVFGILFGAGQYKIAETLGTTDLDAAQEYIALIFNMWPELEKYSQDTEAEILRQGFCETFFGRRRRFPLARIPRHRNRASRQARNFKIQSSSSDVVVGQLIEINEPLRRELNGRLLLTVHDSLAMEIPKKHVGQIKDFIQYYCVQRVKEKYPNLKVPFTCDIEVGDNYGECQDIKKYIANIKPEITVEGIVEEDELLADLRTDAFDSV